MDRGVLLTAYFQGEQQHRQVAGNGDHRLALGTRAFQKAARPWAVRADLHHHQRTRMPAAQRSQTSAVVGDGFLFENLALGVQHAHCVLAISEVDSNGDGG